MYASICTSLSQYNKTEQINIISELKSLYIKYSQNTITMKDKIAVLIIKLFGYKAFSFIQKLRNKQ